MHPFSNHRAGIISRLELETKIDNARTEIKDILRGKNLSSVVKQKLDRISFDINTSAMGHNIEIPHERSKINDNVENALIALSRVKMNLHSYDG